MGSAQHGHQRLSQGTGEAGQRLSDAEDSIERSLRGNPLAAGLIAVGVGALAGSLLPASRTEQRLAHSVREQAEPRIREELQSTGKELGEHLTEEAKHAAQQTADVAKSAAQSTADSAKDAARSTGEHAKDAARSTGEQAKDAAQQTKEAARQGDEGGGGHESASDVERALGGAPGRMGTAPPTPPVSPPPVSPPPGPTTTGSTTEPPDPTAGRSL